MGNFSKAVLIASVALCLHLSAFSQDISLKAKQITVKEAIELLKEKLKKEKNIVSLIVCTGQTEFLFGII